MALIRAVCHASRDKNLLGGLLGLLGQKHGLDVGQNTSLGNGDAGQKLVQLLVVAHSQLQVAGDDPALLVVTGSVSRELEHLGGQVLHNRCEVHGGTSSDTLGIVSFPQVTVDTSHWELETSTAAPGLALSLGFTSFTASRHDDASSIDSLQMPRFHAARLFILRYGPFRSALQA